MGISDITSRPLEGVGISSWLPGVPSCSNSEKGFGVNGRLKIWRRKKSWEKIFFSMRIKLWISSKLIVYMGGLSLFLNLLNNLLDVLLRSLTDITHDLFSRNITASSITKMFCGSCRRDLHLGTIFTSFEKLYFGFYLFFLSLTF